jgi:RNA polymerase sigma-70 factor (ECF subfamily)
MDTPHNDASILEALQGNDDRALNEVIERWQGPLFAFAWRYVQNTADAHDLVAESFVRLHQNKLKLRPDTKLSAWLFTTLSNLCHNQNRWRRRHPTVSFEAQDADTGLAVADRTAAEGPLPSDRLENDEVVAALGKALDELPHELKTTILLHHYENMSYREIGQITGCSERGVETRLYRARQRLRESLAGLMQGTSTQTRAVPSSVPQEL